MDGLKGKKVLITGGARGIGLAIALRLIEEGSNVVVVDKDSSNFPYLLEHYIVAHQMDVSSSSEVARYCPHINADILVHNAAITGGDDYEKIMRTNCDGTRNVTEAVLPGMVARKSGNIVFITSVHTAMPFPNDTAYDGSKGWAVQTMRSLALKYAPLGIRVNAVAPGGVDCTGAFSGVSDSRKAEIAAKIPMRRLALPREIADAVVFLASNQASYITGVELRVDGGLPLANPLYP